MRKYWRETTAVTQRILLELLRRRRSLVFWAIFPMSILLINGYILAERGPMPLDKAMELAAPPTLVGSALFFSCLGGTVSTVVAEREQHTLKRLFISPLSGLSYLLGIFFAYFLIGLGQTLLVYCLAGFFGAEFQGSLALGFLLILLSIMAYVGMGFILGTQLARGTEDINALVGTFGVPLLILGGAFLPTALFPAGLLELAQYNPIFHMNEGLIGIWAKGESLTEISSHLTFLLLFTLFSVLGGGLCYRRMLTRERQF